ncbi:MAG: sensor domain-containing diguanylate cyclase [Methylophaga sp.]|nr:sensor domain-containing diguanylate cyclase [Methylophaga sp.]
MYEHPYTVSNKLKEIKILVHQIHLDSVSITAREVAEIGKKDGLSREALHIIGAQYLGDEADVEAVERLYDNWLTDRLYDDDIGDHDEKILFEQLLQAIAVLSNFADNKAAELYNAAKKDAMFYAMYIGSALLFASILSIVLLLKTLKGLRAMTDDSKQYRHIIDQNVMITAIGDDGLIFDISNELSRYLSVSKKELVGSSLKSVFFSDNDQFKEMWQQVNSGASWHGDVQVVGGQDAKWLGVDVLPMQSGDYRYSGFRLLAHDITSRKSLEKISITDTLTGLLNRRTLDETLTRTTRLSSRNNTPVTIGIFDVDYFKQYNDTYGHMAGDKVLTRLASLVSKMLARPDDYVFRIGGEEFCFIFNSKTLEDSKAYLEKVREAIKDMRIKHEGSAVNEYVTISIGALYLDGNNVVDSTILLSEADDNLYRAKENRNCTVQTEHSAFID